MKKEVDLGRAKWLLEPGCVVLVTSQSAGRPNVMTFSWQTPVNSGGPCLVVLSVNRNRYTYELLVENPELVINVPGAQLAVAVHRAGTISGRTADKFARCGLTPLPSTLVKPPSIAECGAALECKVRDFIQIGIHDLLVCEVVRAEAEEQWFDGGWRPERFHTLHYLGGSRYGVLSERIEVDQGDG